MPNVEIKIVRNFKYLGCLLSSDLNYSNDIERCMTSFNKSVGFILRKFISVEMIFYTLCFYLFVLLFMEQNYGSTSLNLELLLINLLCHIIAH